LHDDGCAETSQDVLLLGCKGQAASAIVFRRVHGAVVIVSQSLFAAGEALSGDPLVSEIVRFRPDRSNA